MTGSVGSRVGVVVWGRRVWSLEVKVGVVVVGWGCRSGWYG